MIRRTFFALFVFAAVVRGDDTEPGAKKLDKAKAEQAVKDYLTKAKATAGAATKIDDKTVDKALPAHHFYRLLFRQYPVAREAPEGLKWSNVLAVGPDGKVQALTTVAEMEKFFKAHVKGLSTNEKAKQAGQAFLRLGRELYQDGFYTFDDDAKSFEVVLPVKQGSTVTGKTTAMRGGSGTLNLTMDIDGKGVITSAKMESKLRAGPRPICQATKLLDADPVVRKMAEQSLLIMGRAAKGYLDEQRAKASPELKKAIDRMWRRIVEDE